jgi:hypothetical protein
MMDGQDVNQKSTGTCWQAALDVWLNVETALTGESGARIVKGRKGHE